MHEETGPEEWKPGKRKPQTCRDNSIMLRTYKSKDAQREGDILRRHIDTITRHLKLHARWCCGQGNSLLHVFESLASTGSEHGSCHAEMLNNSVVQA